MKYGYPEIEIVILCLDNCENLYFTIYFHVKAWNVEFVFHNKMYTKKCMSEGARGIIFSLVSFKALGSKCMETTVKSVANSFQELFHSRHYVCLAPESIWHLTPESHVESAWCVCVQFKSEGVSEEQEWERGSVEEWDERREESQSHESRPVWESGTEVMSCSSQMLGFNFKPPTMLKYSGHRQDVCVCVLINGFKLQLISTIKATDIKRDSITLLLVWKLKITALLFLILALCSNLMSCPRQISSISVVGAKSISNSSAITCQ